jgi:hypothetical protein
VFTELGETRTSRQGKRGFTKSPVNPTRKPLWALNLRPSFNDNFVDIQRPRGEQRLLATSINLAARRSLLRCATCLPILDAARWWTRTTISRVKMRPETINACHARKKDNGVVDLEIRGELLGFWANDKCDGP